MKDLVVVTNPTMEIQITKVPAMEDLVTKGLATVVMEVMEAMGTTVEAIMTRESQKPKPSHNNHRPQARLVTKDQRRA